MAGHLKTMRQRGENGVIITLVAVFLLFVVGAMAALSIDIVTFYTARSEAQLAADSAALAGARVLANSGMTSDLNYASDNVVTNAEQMAGAVAVQVAAANQVGGRTLVAPVSPSYCGQEICVSFNDKTSPSFLNNPHVTVRVNRSDIPVFFARIWGNTQVSISATATAEAYNPSGLANISSNSSSAPVALTCVKPLVIANLDPLGGSIFDQYGNVLDAGLLGAQFPLHARCNGGCSPPTPQAWQYFVGNDQTSFPPPTQALPACTGSNFQLGIAGCVPVPITCGNQVDILLTYDSNLDQDAADAVNCLTHSTNGNGDTASLPPPPFQFTMGAENPIVQAGFNPGTPTQTMLSDSLVTIPVSANSPIMGTSVTIVGFVQLFLQPAGTAAVASSPQYISSEIINLIGCSSSPAGAPVYGNGPTAVPVRLITPP